MRQENGYKDITFTWAIGWAIKSFAIGDLDEEHPGEKHLQAAPRTVEKAAHLSEWRLLGKEASKTLCEVGQGGVPHAPVDQPVWLCAYCYFRDSKWLRRKLNQVARKNLCGKRG